jgi:hypothetical protein
VNFAHISRANPRTPENQLAESSYHWYFPLLDFSEYPSQLHFLSQSSLLFVTWDHYLPKFKAPGQGSQSSQYRIALVWLIWAARESKACSTKSTEPFDHQLGRRVDITTLTVAQHEYRSNHLLVRVVRRTTIAQSWDSPTAYILDNGNLTAVAAFVPTPHARVVT